MNLYAYAGNNPIAFRDPYGLCPPCAAAYALFEAASSAYDAYDLAKTGVNYLRGEASGTELSLTAAGAAAGITGFGGGYGKAGRLALNKALGEAGEAAVGAATGLAKNSTSRLGSRVPDFVDKAGNAFHESKNVAKLSLTKQIREMVANLGEGQKLIIHVRQGGATRVSGSFDALVEQGLVEIRQTIPVQ